MHAEGAAGEGKSRAYNIRPPTPGFGCVPTFKTKIRVSFVGPNAAGKPAFFLLCLSLLRSRVFLKILVWLIVPGGAVDALDLVRLCCELTVPSSSLDETSDGL